MYSKSSPRRRHSSELKTKVLAACDEPGASVSGVALAHGLNANLVRKWRSGRGVKFAASVRAEPPPNREPSRRPLPAASPLIDAGPEFVAIEMPTSRKTMAEAAADHVDATPSADALIHIELRRGPLHLNVRWPTSGAEDCVAWLRELCSSLLK